MLVLSRKIGERLKIGNDVFVEILEVKGNRIRLGITAPRDVAVMREEILENSQELKNSDSITR